jgi:hypothetical protein
LYKPYHFTKGHILNFWRPILFELHLVESIWHPAKLFLNPKIMKSKKKAIQSRRRFIGNTSVLATGMVLGGPSLFGAPSIIKSYNKPNSKINGVQIGCITYSFRSMQDQSAEATLKYVLDSGINAIELMGDPAEMFAGKPENLVDRRAYYGIMRKKSGGTELSEDEEKELADMTAQNDAYNVEVVQWRTGASMDKFAQLKKCTNLLELIYTDSNPVYLEQGIPMRRLIMGLRRQKHLVRATLLWNFLGIMPTPLSWVLWPPRMV